MDVIWMAQCCRIDEWQGKLSSFPSSRPCSHIYPSLQPNEQEESSAEKDKSEMKVRSTNFQIIAYSHILSLLLSTTRAWRSLEGQYVPHQHYRRRFVLCT